MHVGDQDVVAGIILVRYIHSLFKVCVVFWAELAVEFRDRFRDKAVVHAGPDGGIFQIRVHSGKR
jgi:hypothetical protein